MLQPRLFLNGAHYNILNNSLKNLPACFSKILAKFNIITSDLNKVKIGYKVGLKLKSPQTKVTDSNQK